MHPSTDTNLNQPRIRERICSSLSGNWSCTEARTHQTGQCSPITARACAGKGGQVTCAHRLLIMTTLATTSLTMAQRRSPRRSGPSSLIRLVTDGRAGGVRGDGPRLFGVVATLVLRRSSPSETHRESMPATCRLQAPPRPSAERDGMLSGLGSGVEGEGDLEAPSSPGPR